MYQISDNSSLDGATDDGRIVRPKDVEQNKKKRLFVRICASCWFIYTFQYDAGYIQRKTD
jgi:hypothetical protein